MVRQRLFLPLLVVLGQLKRTDAGYNCSVIPDAAGEGECARLTCRFPVDIQENTKNFYVQISNDSVFKIDEKVVVDCGWPKQSPFPACTKAEGYSEPFIHGHTVTIDIVNADVRQAGHYKCFVVNPDTQSTPDSCVFTVVGSSPQSESEAASGTIVGIAVGCSIAVVLFFAVFVAAYWKRKRRKDQKRQRVPTSEREAIEINHGNFRNTRLKGLTASASNLEKTRIVSRLAAEFEERDRQARESMHAN